MNISLGSGSAINREVIFGLVSKLQELLSAENVRFSLAGSVSALMGIGERYTRPVHDLDLIILNSDFEKMKLALGKSGFDFWDETFIHRTARRLTGGYGRHHNFGFCSSQYLQGTGNPIWGGIFVCREEPNGISFHEFFAISERKIKLMASGIVSDLNQLYDTDRRYLTDVLEADIDKVILSELIQLMAELGMDFWSEINYPEINLKDLRSRVRYSNLERRLLREPLARVRYQKPIEHYFEFCLTTRYPITSTEYLFSQSSELPNGKTVNSVPLEVVFLRASRFYPHYLGKRRKYSILSAALRKANVLLKARLEYFEDIYRRQEKDYRLMDDFHFEMGADGTLNTNLLRSIWDNGKRAAIFGEPNYLSLLP